MTNDNRTFHRGTGMTSGEKALTASQVEKLLGVIDSIPDMAIFSLAIATGIRREDVVNIKRHDFNPVEATITFYEEKKNITRTVFIPDRTLQHLKMYMNSAGKTSSEWLFPSPYDEKAHISGRHIYRRLNNYLTKADLPQRPFHALRATCYKLLQEKGWKAEDAARYIGDSVKVAMEHYGTPSQEEIRAMVKGMPAL